MRLGYERHVSDARRLLEEHSGLVGEELARSILDAPQDTDTQVSEQRVRVAELKERLAQHSGASTGPIRHLASLTDELVKKSVWIVGGDGWAYDIGFGGLDTSWAPGATSTSWCSTPRSTPTPVARPPRRPSGGHRRSSPPPARRRRRRTSARSPRPTATSTSLRSRSAPTRCRRCGHCLRPKPGRVRRSSSPTAPASPTASRCPRR